ncbi:protein LONGIFOLIA 1-like [Phoenix dactylifera]|uniref:Protein LONGIFOLIA 1-like n=1 Tax=Phoenix dactylifera TaxID=42345 RepID=A0A8B7BFF7_PHODC|nr:protein LONGIFOLIA 1-like [Phoenix dactylifera]
MMPGDGRGIANDQSLERQFERQMGCMAGFLQLFDRHHVLAGKRIYAARRLPSSPVAGSMSPSDRSEVSSVSFLNEIQRFPSPEACPSSPESRDRAAEASARPSLPLPLPVFDFKDVRRSSWRLREAPRLSLDSRAVVDARGKLRPREIRTAASGNQSDSSEAADESEGQRRSPSVVARLMGLEALPDVGGGGGGGGEPKRAELRRSASESRVPRDYRFVDVSSFQKPLPDSASSGKEFFWPDFGEFRLRDAKLDAPPRTLLPPLQRKSFFDARDFFPEPPKRTGSLYGEIERRLRMRGIDEPAKDLETLKQILEAIQLKGLLHTKPSDPQINGRRNFMYDQHHDSQIPADDFPVAVMKPPAKPSRRPASEPPGNPSRSTPARRTACSDGGLPPARARRDRAEFDRNPRGINDRRTRTPRSPEPISPVRRRPPLNAEPPRSPQPQRRISAVQSPKASPKRLAGPDPLAIRSPRNRRVTPDVSPKDRIYSPAEDDASTIVSESSISCPSQLDFERSRAEEHRAGRSLLERCDKLLHSIAAITGAEQVTAVEQQPSPVSVLDSSFLCDESSPSPVTKRSIDFKDRLAEWEDGHWSPATPAVRKNGAGGLDAEDHDYVYVSEIVRVSDLVRDTSDGFAVLEKRHQASSKASHLHRRLVFDTVAEILDRKRHVFPWEAFTRSRSLPSAGDGDGGAAPLVREVWVEVRRIREPVHPADDLNDVTCGAIRKDLAGERGWGPCPAADMSDAVLHIERQIFKDLVAETIRYLADLSSSPPSRPRRKLFF